MLLRLTHKERIAEDVVLFELRAADGSDLPEFTCGAHLSIRVPNGFERKYSISNDPSERDRYVIAVKRDASGRGGSISLADEATIGDDLEVGPPQNDFQLAPSPPGYIFVAGGIGITPIMSMIRHIRSAGDGRFKLYYLTRSPETTAFRDELSQPEFRGKVKMHHDHGDPAKVFDLWPVFERPNGMHVYCCGPRPLMDAVKDMTGHWSSKAIHFEAFSDAAGKRADDVAFDVRLAHSGEIVRVPADVSILEALRAAGHRVPSSCESGACGSCRTGLLEGEVDHRDLVLTEAERSRNIMVCVSRAKTPQIALDM
ncbi:MAG TPA: PDR/VanB family oxidoreductase [Beijerinckiaceae bacterium]|nr:PDR/VanB family oxidoreductase [Beijerinckiaceae bacterium]HVB88634.1 PDR/VanB family oxidoreductase [Beijerinckiaceae bacterium]